MLPNVVKDGTLNSKNSIISLEGDLGAQGSGTADSTKPDWHGKNFDIIALALGDAVLSKEGRITKSLYNTLKVSRSQARAYMSIHNKIGVPCRGERELPA